MRAVVVGVVIAASASCTKANLYECEAAADCDFLVGGTCVQNPATGTSWCAAPDTSCPSGYRWDQTAVGDGVAGTCTPAGDAAPSSCVAQLAWVSNRDGSSDIFIGNADGTDTVNLTHSVESEGYPVWSPDGLRLAFSREGELWVMNADGTEPQQITSDNTDSAPQWSPDVSAIAFIRKPPTISEFSIWLVNPDDPDPTNISLDTTASDKEVVWSPDGTTLAFVSRVSGQTDLYTMNTSGLDRMNRSNDGDVDEIYHRPAFAPNGSNVLYVSESTGDREVWAVPPTGGTPQNLTQSPSTADDGSPEGGSAQWSPDSSTIYFARSTTTAPLTMQLYSMTAAGTSQTPLGLLAYSETWALFDAYPVLSSDGTTLAWSSYRDGDAEIYVSALDGGPIIRLTNAPGADELPTWRPCP